MNTRLVNSAAGVVQAAQAKDRTAAGIALALESAGLLMSPEIAAELERLRARVAELVAAQDADHKTWQHDLRTARTEREASAARIAEPSSVFRASRDGHLLGLYSRQEDALSHCEDAARRGVDRSNPMSWRKRADGTRELLAWTSRDVEGSTGFTVAPIEVRPEFDEGWGEDADEPDGITRLIAPTQALREDEASPVTCADHDPAMECADGKCSCPCGKPCTCGGCCGCCTSFCSHDSYCASAWLHSGRDDA